MSQRRNDQPDEIWCFRTGEMQTYAWRGMNQTCLVSGVFLNRLAVKGGSYVVLGGLVVRVEDYDAQRDVYTVAHVAGPRYLLLEGDEDNLPGRGI